jgi:GAF domain-containing protein
VVADDRARLDLLYDLAKRLGAMENANELIAHATERIREFYGAEGCSVLLLDRTGHYFLFPTTAQERGSQTTPDALARIRFPADQGVAGWVLQHGDGLWVPDTAADDRFYSGVDQMTGAVTRSLLCVPLRTLSGKIGVVEVINPATIMPEEDVAFLSTLASDLALAYEKADLQGHIRRELQEVRSIGFTVGLGLIGVGLLVASLASMAHLALALPLPQLFLRPGVLAGVALAASGGFVLVALRRRTRVSPLPPADTAVPAGGA